MCQARRFRQVFVVKLERRRHAGIEHFQAVAEHFNLATGQSCILGSGRARPHQSDDLQAELIAHILGHLEHRGPIRIANDLDQTFTVA